MVSEERNLRVADGCVLLPVGPGGSDVKVHPRWLRERCAAPESVEEASRQPWRSLSHPKRARAAAALATTAHGQGDTLHVGFDDGHTARLDLARIKEEHASFAGAGALMAERIRSAPAPRPWDSQSLVMHYADHAALELHRDRARLTDGAVAARRELLEAVLRDGVSLVRGAPCASHEVERFARELVGAVRETNWGSVFDVRSSPGSADADGQADQAYGAAEIDFHVDNPYRTPIPEFQLLHCIAWEGRDGRGPDEGANRLVDGIACAERLRETDRAAFDLLAATPLKWENDAPLTALEPAIQLSADGARVQRVFVSSKSGGFAPPLPPAELDAFYAAFDKMTALLESDEFVVTNRLEPGDIIFFQNSRVLHARNAFSGAVTRHLQGLYVDVDAVERSLALLSRGEIASARLSAQSGPKWTSLTECTGEDVRRVCAEYSADQRENRVGRVLDMLRSQRGAHSELGAPVDLFQHGLQTATRAHAAGESVDVVVAALLHDIGELFVPENHGEVPAAILGPYIDPDVTQMLRQHEIFQAQFYGDKAGLDVDRAKLREFPAYELTQRFCEKYDQTSFDPAFESHPVSFFQPMVEEVFARKPYWHTPGHIKDGLVTG